MSNNNEINPDEQIEQLNQRLQNMAENSKQENFSVSEEAVLQENTGENAAQDENNTEKNKKNEPLTFNPEETNSEEQTDEAENLSSEQIQNSENNPENTRSSAAQPPAEDAIFQNTALAGTAEKCFNIFSKLGLPLLILFTLILCGQQFLFPRDFWFSEEVRYADIYMNMLSSHNFFTLTLNGHPYAETGPLYFILVWLLDAIPNINMPQAFFGASILFAVFFTASTWILARGLNYSGKVAFAAGLLALSMFFLASFTNYTRMDLLFAGFLNLSYVCFFRAWQKNSAPVWLLFAFLFLCFAALTSTFIAFILPFIASILFFLWTAKYRRINSTDGIIGFLISILIIFAWFAYIYFQGNADYISLLLEEQIIQNYTPLSAFKTEPYWFYLAGLPFALFPWIFIILFASWGKWLKNSPQAFKARKENNGSAWLILLIITHLIVFSVLKDKSFSNLVTIIPFFAILFAKSLLSFSPLRSKVFFGFLALLTSLCGIFFIVIEFHGYILEYLPNLWALPKEIPAFVEVLTKNTSFGLTAMGAILILLGVLLWYGVNRQFAGGSLLIYTIGIILTLQPVNLLVAPQLGTVFSTKNHACEMAKVHQNEGAIPASYHIYPDVFTYYYNEALDSTKYSKATIANLNDIDSLTDFLLKNDKVILAIPEKDFEELPYKNEAAVLEYKQWIEHQYIILTSWNMAAHKPDFDKNSNETEEEITNNSDELSVQNDTKMNNSAQASDISSASSHDNTENSGAAPDEQTENPAPTIQENGNTAQSEPAPESTEQNPQTKSITEQNAAQEAKKDIGQAIEKAAEPIQEQKTESITAPAPKEVTL